VRNYGYIKSVNDAQDEYFIVTSRGDNVVRYVPVTGKIAMQKKKRMQTINLDEEDMLVKA
jgi:hypothetical protein